jgi:hypothetical protein
MVLAYIFHVTQVKGGGKLTSDLRGGDGPPNVARLVCRADAPATHAQFVTAISPHPIYCGVKNGWVSVSLRGQSWTYALDNAGLCYEKAPVSRV